MKTLLLAIALLPLVGCATTRTTYVIRGEYKGVEVVAEIQR